MIRDRGETATRVEAFVDAAFAFALTLLAIAGDRIPASVAELEQALLGLPAFAASFLLVVKVWTGHVEWSRAFGLDDAASRRLSLLLVFLVLVFVYPMRMVFATLFNSISDGLFPANFAIDGLHQVPVLFVTFGIAFGSLGATMSALYAHAWRQREALGLDAAERIDARSRVVGWGLIPVVAIVSIACALLIPPRAESGWWIGFPGFIYFSLNVSTHLIRRRVRRLKAGLAAA